MANELTVVIPTKGRPTIERALESLYRERQKNYFTDVVVVYDSHGSNPNGYYQRNYIEDLCSVANARFLEFDAGYNDWGYPQLEYIYKMGPENGNYLMNIGDDDVMIEGAIPRILDIIDENGIQPYMFQAVLYPSPHRGNTEPVTLWNDSDRSLTRQRITGQNLILPNIPHFMAPMVDDCSFIQQTIDNWRGLVKWVPVEIVSCY